MSMDTYISEYVFTYMHPEWTIPATALVHLSKRSLVVGALRVFGFGPASGLSGLLSPYCEIFQDGSLHN